MDLFENHQQGEGGSDLSEEKEEGQDIEPAAEPADDTKEAQPSLDEATGGGRTGTIDGGATNAPGEEGGDVPPPTPGEVNVGDHAPR